MTLVMTSVMYDYFIISVVIAAWVSFLEDKKMTKKKNPLVFMDVSVDGDPVERMVFEVLFVN